jgi:iron complex outermembrane receptor protein
MTHPTSRKLPLATAIAAVITGATCPPLALAQEQQLEEIVVTGSLRSLPGEDVNIFGFGKSLLETPRSASTISFEQMDRFNITDIDELVAFAPGTFTQSFFGVAGSLDIRGTRARTTSAAIRRIDNPGNYPTAYRRLGPHRCRTRARLAHLRPCQDRRVPELQSQVVARRLR